MTAKRSGGLFRASNGAGAAAQTRHYAGRTDELARQLRAEIRLPPDGPRGAPALVALIGLPGSGKTHSARILAARLGAAHIASDELRSRLFVAASYAPRENSTIFACLDALVEALLRERQRVVIDATHLSASSRVAPVATSARCGVPLVWVRIVADEAATLERLERRQVERAEHDHSDADRTIYERMRALPFEAPAGGHLEVVNGPDLLVELERVAHHVEVLCAAAS